MNICLTDLEKEKILDIEIVKNILVNISERTGPTYDKIFKEIYKTFIQPKITQNRRDDFKYLLPKEALKALIKNNNIEMIKWICQFSEYSPFSKLKKCLEFAIFENKSDIFIFLFGKFNREVGTEIRLGDQFLDVACARGCFEIVKYLMEEYDFYCFEKTDLFLKAVFSGNFKLVTFIDEFFGYPVYKFFRAISAYKMNYWYGFEYYADTHCDREKYLNLLEVAAGRDSSIFKLCLLQFSVQKNRKEDQVLSNPILSEDLKKSMIWEMVVNGRYENLCFFLEKFQISIKEIIDEKQMEWLLKDAVNNFLQVSEEEKCKNSFRKIFQILVKEE